MVKGKREFPPDQAIAYVGSYEGKNGKAGGKYIKLILKEDLAAGTELIAFPKTRTKRNETDPDFGFQLSTRVKGSSAKRAPVAKAASDDIDF